VAGDLVQPPASLAETATLAEAFHLMHERHLSGVYVVDAAGRPTGYLDGLELAAAVVAEG
jgi:CBS domain-containing protein